MRSKIRKSAAFRLAVLYGLLLPLGLVAVVELLSRAGFSIPSLTILIAAVAFAAFVGGLWAGLIGATLISLYGAYTLSSAAPLFDYTAEHGVRLLLLIAAAFATALMMGNLRRTLQAAQLELQQQLAWRTAIDQSLGEGVYALDHEGRVTFMNPAAERLLGWSEAELLGKMMHQVSHYQHADGTPYPREQCSGLQVLRHGRAYRTEDDTFTRKDGSMFSVAYSSSPMIRNGEVVGAVVAFRDVTECKRAERALRESEAKLRLINAQIPAHLWISDPNLCITAVSGSALTRVGVDPSAFVGKHLDELLGTADQRAPIVMAHRRALAGQSAEYEQRTADREFACHVEPLRNSQGQIVGCLGLALDITGRKRNERRLQTQYEVSRIVAEATRLGDAAPQLLQSIGACLEWDYGGLWIIDERDLVLRCVATWHTPAADLPQFLAASRQARLKRGQALPGRVWADGEPVWIADTRTEERFPRLKLAAAEGLRAGLGVPIQVAGQTLGVLEFFSREARPPGDELLHMIRSLSSQIGQFIERKQAEAALQVQARQQAAVAEFGRRAMMTPDLATIMDAATALVVQTLELERCQVLELLPDEQTLLLRSGVGGPGQLVGRATLPVDPGTHLGAALHARGPVAVENVGRESSLRVAAPLGAHDVGSAVAVVIHGRKHPFGVLDAAAAQPRRFSADDVHFLQAMAHGLAAAIERKAFEEQILQQRAEATRLEELDRLRRNFVLSVSHELRTPLTAARGGLGMLELSSGERLRPAERTLLTTTRRNIERLRMLIDDLLVYHQLEAGTFQLRCAPLDLRTVVQDALQAICDLMQHKQQQIRLDLPQPLPGDGDRERLLQVLMNVLTYMYEQMPDNTQIQLSDRSTPAELLLVVSSDGPRVVVKDVQTIFQRFHRLGLAEDGAGVGLAVAQAIVERHGGRIAARSEAGLGLVVEIGLPRPRAA